MRNIAIVAMTQILLQARNKYSHIQSHNLSEEKCTTTDQAKGAEHNLTHFRSRKVLPSSPHKPVKGSTFSKVSKEQELQEAGSYPEPWPAARLTIEANPGG